MDSYYTIIVINIKVYLVEIQQLLSLTQLFSRAIKALGNESVAFVGGPNALESLSLTFFS